MTFARSKAFLSPVAKEPPDCRRSDHDNEVIRQRFDRQLLDSNAIRRETPICRHYASEYHAPTGASHMRRLLSTAVGMALIALPPSPLHTHDNPSLFDVFSIRATTGGYYLRTVSPKGDRINATCQSIRKGTWDFAVEVYPAASATVKYQASPALNLSGTWVYPLRAQGHNYFLWTAPNSAAFALFLQRVSGMGWGQNFVSRDLNVDFQSHGSDDAGTIAAFAHLCRLPGVSPNAY
jgi:hypothetical protein